MNENDHKPARLEEDDRQWQRLAAVLPREVEPGRDLWPSIASRLAERPVEEQEEPRRTAPWLEWWRETWRSITSSFPPSWGVRGWGVRGWAVQAAAALLFMSLGAGLARLGERDAPALSAERPGRAAEASFAAEASSETSFAAAEAQYLRAKESLWLLVMSRRDELSPVTLRVIDRNLGIIDDAIRDLRRALAADPGNRQLESLLLAQHRRGIDLLQKLAEPSV